MFSARALTLMQAVMHLAARLYRLTYSEIWHMATINAATVAEPGRPRRKP